MTTTDPPTGSPSPASRLVSLAPLVAMPVFLLLVTLLYLRPIGDPDAWWHLRLGAELPQGWDFGHPPAWTRFATQPWVPTQWLPEVVSSWWQGRLGLAGLVWLLGLVAVALVVLTYAVCRRQGGPLPAMLGTVLTFAAVSPTLTPRPQVVTFVLLTVVVGAWLGTVRDLRPRWWLVPLSWFWASCHGLWFSGAVVGLVVAVGLWLDRRVDRREALRLLAIPLLSVVVAALTPVGPRLLFAPFAVGDIRAFITEWQTPSIRDLAPAVTLLMVVVVVLAAARRRERTAWTVVGLVLLAVFWALLSVRTVSLAAIIVAPLFTQAVAGVVPRRGASPGPLPKREAWWLAGSGAVCVLLSAALVAALPGLRQPANVPTGLEATLDWLPAHTVIWNDFTLGGWIDWRHRNLEVVVDGRAEAFGAAWLEAYGKTMATDPGWDDRIRQSGAHLALLLPDSALADALQHRLGWRAVGADGGYVLLSDGMLL